jgi:hypothetical protein
VPAIRNQLHRDRRPQFPDEELMIRDRLEHRLAAFEQRFFAADIECCAPLGKHGRRATDLCLQHFGASGFDLPRLREFEVPAIGAHLDDDLAGRKATEHAVAALQLLALDLFARHAKEHEVSQPGHFGCGGQLFAAVAHEGLVLRALDAHDAVAGAHQIDGHRQADIADTQNPNHMGGSAHP